MKECPPFPAPPFWKGVPRLHPACRMSCQIPAYSLTPRPFLPFQVYTRYGKCYTFNGDRRNPRVTRQGGMGNGLEIMLDIQQEEYLPIWRETSEWGRGAGRAGARGAGREGCWASRASRGGYGTSGALEGCWAPGCRCWAGVEVQPLCPSPTDETSFEAGIRVQIHSQDEPPYIHQLGFGVSPGFQTFVSCQEQRVRQDAPQPLGGCPRTPSLVQLCSDAPLAPAAHLPATALGQLPGQRAGGADAARLRHLQHRRLPPAVREGGRGAELPLPHGPHAR